jgi:uncharacterized protein DUF4242
MDQDELDSPPTRTFLVERYWPDIDEATARAVVSNLERAALAMTAEGTAVEHVVSILMPNDRVVFSLIRAADETAARQVNERADVPLDRIAAAIALGLHGR